MSEQKTTNEKKNEAKTDSLVDFFKLLLEVDMRNNPDRYKQGQKNDWYSSAYNSSQ